MEINEMNEKDMTDNMSEKREEIQKILDLATPTEQDLNNQIKKEDKKSFGKFVAIMVICMLLGFFVGMGFAFVSGNYELTGITFLQNLSNFNLKVSGIAQYGIIVFVVVCTMIAAILLSISNRRLKQLDPDDEQEVKKIEGLLGNGMLVSSLLITVGLIIFGIAYYCQYSDAVKSNKVVLLTALVVFILSIPISTIMQKKFLNLTKKLYPEKRGSVYDTKFKDKWINSCDEAEQMIIYKASYATYQKLTGLFLAMTVILVCAGMFIEIGILPLIIVGIAMTFMTICFVVESAKLEKRK